MEKTKNTNHVSVISIVHFRENDMIVTRTTANQDVDVNLDIIEIYMENVSFYKNAVSNNHQILIKIKKKS